MAVAGPVFVPYEMKTNIVKIYSYERKNLVGTISNPFFDGARSFENLSQLILALEEMQDTLNFPQKGMESRRFGPSGPVELLSEIDITETNKPLASFKIRILFRQNASWQGSVFWLEKKQESQFRSVLELILLFDSALSPEDGQEQTI